MMRFMRRWPCGGAFLIVILPWFVSFAQQAGSAVVVGGVTERAARFWLRSGHPAQLAVEVALTPAFNASTISSTVVANAEDNFAGVVEVDGLLPNTRYYYRPLIDGSAGQRGGTFLTFPEPGMLATFTFAFGSCQQSGRFLPGGTEAGNVFRQVVKEEPLFFLQLGDWGYPDTTDALPDDSTFFAADFARVQSSYLTKFNATYPMDSLLRIAPVAYVYDDHDFMNDNASALSSAFSLAYKPNPYGDDFLIRDIANPPGARGNSIRGYRENMPSYPLVNESRGIYQRFSCGPADFFLLDLRSQRSPNLEAFAKDSQSGLWEFVPGGEHTILGRGGGPGTGESQFAWLLRELRSSTGTWKFLVSSVPFNQGFSTAIQAGVFFQTLSISNPLVPPGTSLLGVSLELADKWVGFPADAESLLSFVRAEGIDGVIVLSGDSHTAAMDDGANAGLPEIMAGGLDITNSQIVKYLDDFGIKIWNKGGQGLTTQEFNNAYGKVTVFGEDSVRLELVDEFGTMFAAHTVLSRVTGIEPDVGVPPGNYRLEQNFPNPFNPTTIIEFYLARRAKVRLTVHTLLGQLLAVVVDDFLEAGTHRVEFISPQLATGTYFYRLEVVDGIGNGYAATRAMTVIR